MLRAIQSLSLVAVACGTLSATAIADVPFLNPIQTFSEPFDPNVIDPVDYGCSVAVDGDTAAAADYGQHAVLIYRRPGRGGTWVEREKLPHRSAQCSSVAIHGDTLIFEDAGVLRVYVDDGSQWSLQATLKAEDEEKFGRRGFRGVELFLHRNTVAANTPNAAHVFVREGSAWARQARLSGERALALHGDTLLVQDNIVPDQPRDPAPRPVYVFERSANTWVQRQALLPLGEVTSIFGGSEFGAAAAIHENVAVIGAPRDAENTIPVFEDPTGAAYVFVRKHGNWTQQQKLTTPFSSESNPYLAFGEVIAVERNRIVIGAPDSGGAILGFPGKIYGFVRHGLQWTEEFRWPDRTFGVESHGGSLSLSNGTLLEGAIGHPEFTFGSLAFFELNTPPALTDVAVRSGDHRSLHLRATVDDSGTGGSNIRSGYYSLNGGKWQPMRAADGVFDEPTEGVLASINNLRHGVHRICVVGVDGLRNVSRRECVRHVVKKPRPHRGR